MWETFALYTCNKLRQQTVINVTRRDIKNPLSIIPLPYHVQAQSFRSLWSWDDMKKVNFSLITFFWTYRQRQYFIIRCCWLFRARKLSSWLKFNFEYLIWNGWFFILAGHEFSLQPDKIRSTILIFMKDVLLCGAMLVKSLSKCIRSKRSHFKGNCRHFW